VQVALQELLLLLAVQEEVQEALVIAALLLAVHDEPVIAALFAEALFIFVAVHLIPAASQAARSAGVHAFVQVAEVILVLLAFEASQLFAEVLEVLAPSHAR
jgi:hypothetical protein